jgi:hypothetical protein
LLLRALGSDAAPGRFLLDGDKLFSLRAAVVADRPWWRLPLNTQLYAAPTSVASVLPMGRAFRVVLLEPLAESTSVADSLNATVASCKLVPAEEGRPIDATPTTDAVTDTHGRRFAALESTFEAPTACLEVRVVAIARLPPFQVEVRAAPDASWELLACQPMPTADEPCNSGRDRARCAPRPSRLAWAHCDAQRALAVHRQLTVSWSVGS